MGSIYLNSILYGNKDQVIDIRQEDYDALSSAEKMNGALYFIRDGVPSAEAASIIANPQDEPTEVLQSIKIGDTVYSLPQGGGGGSIFRQTSFSAVAQSQSTITIAEGTEE